MFTCGNNMLLPGDRLGRYQIQRLINTGATGQVFLAESAAGAQVAVKLLHAELLDQQEVVARFYNEARAARAVRHPGVVVVHEEGALGLELSPAPVPYFVMERLGHPLHALLRGPLPVRVAAGVGMQVADALAAVHQVGIVHRDVKPQNLLCAPTCTSLAEAAQAADGVRVCDFGLAKVPALYQGDHKRVSTADGTMMGSAAYTAPEQWRDPARVDGRTDVYALGIILYQMVAGALPFRSQDEARLMAWHLYQMPPPLPIEVPAGLRHLIAAMLAKRFVERPDAAAVASRLMQIAEENGHR